MIPKTSLANAIKIAGYNKVRKRFIQKLKALKHPFQDEPLYKQVHSIVPRILDPYEGTIAVLKFKNVPEEREMSLGGMLDTVTIYGSVFTFTPGDSDDALSRAMSTAEYLEGLIRHTDFLEMDTCLTSIYENNAQNWTIFDLGAHPDTTFNHVFSVTSFKIQKQLETVQTGLEF